MKIRTAAMSFVFISAMTLAAQQHNSTPPIAASHSAHEAAGTVPQTKDLSANLARMRALLQRMQSNLPAVASGQSPLEHEFQLEIEMWQLLIDQMDAQVKASSPPAQ